MAANEDSRPLNVDTKQRTANIARLNDDFRRGRSPGRVVLTSGIQALGPRAILAIATAVEAFDAFTPDNDPYGEHDFGAFDWQGQKLFWKVDAYDRNVQHGSPDPMDPAVTTRVLTIMLAAEY